MAKVKIKQLYKCFCIGAIWIFLLNSVASSILSVEAELNI